MIELTLSIAEPLDPGFHPVPESTAHLELSAFEAWLAGDPPDDTDDTKDTPDDSL